MAPRVNSRDFEQLAEEDGHPQSQSPPAPRTSESGAAAAAARAQRNKWLAAAVVGWAVLLIFVRCRVFALSVFKG